MTYKFIEKQLVDNTHKEEDNHRHLVCEVSFPPYGNFTTLGLPVGQLELSTKENKWLEEHKEEIEKALKERSEIPRNVYYEQMTKEQRLAIKKPFKLLDLFCKECNIKDT
jgi:hypothetical protein